MSAEEELAREVKRQAWLEARTRCGFWWALTINGSIPLTDPMHHNNRCHEHEAPLTEDQP